MAGFIYKKNIGLWKEKFDQDELQRWYDDGPRAFRRGMHLDPHSEEERKLPSFEAAVEAGRGLSVAELLERWPDCYRFTGFDPGGDKRPGSSIVTLGQWGPKRFPLAVKFGAWGPTDAAKALVREYLRWLPLVVYCENNSLQKAYIDLILNIYVKPIPLKGFLTGLNKTDPNIGIEGIDAELARGQWIIPSDEFYPHEVGCKCDWCRWRSEVLNYPNYETQDGLMSTWFAWNAARRGGSGTGVEVKDYGRRTFAEEDNRRGSAKSRFRGGQPVSLPPPDDASADGTYESLGI